MRNGSAVAGRWGVLRLEGDDGAGEVDEGWEREEWEESGRCGVGSLGACVLSDGCSLGEGGWWTWRVSERADVRGVVEVE